MSEVLPVTGSRFSRWAKAMKCFFVFLCIIAVQFFSLVGFVFSSENGKAAVARDCNIVLITIDTLRADHLSCYGYYRNTTPFIDELAESAMIFTNVIAPSSWTSPSMETV